MFQLTLQAPLNSDELLFLPCNITTSSNIQVLGIAETVTNDESSWMFKQTCNNMVIVCTGISEENRYVDVGA